MNLFPRLSVAVVLIHSLISPNVSAQSQLNYTTSWIGNSFGFGDGKWMQQDIQAISVGADGTVYTNSPWDESGSEIAAYRAGDKLAVAGSTHGWGAAGGDAVAVNHTYLYGAMSIGNESNALVGADYPPSNQTWYGITRRMLANLATGASFSGGIGNSANATKNSFLKVETVTTGTDASIRGLAATDSELYVADTYGNRIVVYDAQSMLPLRSWSVASPARIAIDTDSTLWIISGFGTANLSILHYRADGTALAGPLSLPAGTVPTDLTVTPSGQLLVADNGVAQQILVFNKGASGQMQASTTIGTRNGIFHPTRGVPGDVRFNGITGIGADTAGNLYVAQNGAGPRAPGSALVGQGAVLESYGYGSRVLNWRLYGLTFVDSGAFDPATPASVYTGSKRFTLNYNQPVGHEWSYAAFTLDRFDFPDDPAFHEPRGVRGEPMVRRFDGQRFLYTLDSGAHYLNVYRFDATHGEIAIPSGLLAQNPLPGTWPAGQPTYGEWLWRDSNGDGAVDASEISSNPSTGSTVGNGFWWVDETGNVWLATPLSGVREMPLQGLDSAGNPIYTYASSKMFAMPAPFTRLARLVYIASTDTMYLSGFTSAIPWDSTHWKEAGPLLARYDNWSTSTPTRTYTISLPWNTQSDPQTTTVGVAVAGNYIFVAELYTDRVDVYDARNGSAVGYMTPGASVGGTSGWVDVYLGISAVQRSNGEYVVLVEDDARAKILMYRWTP
ncbi:NHL repeat containing protein [Burkholderia sp. H160]|nr:NHL repeat containing protein [Burkholderia sp. H160]